MDMIAKKQFRYGGALRKPGDPVALRPGHVRLMRALGRVGPVDADATEPNNESSEDLDREKSETAAREAAAAGRATYATRDMTAQQPRQPESGAVPAVARRNNASGKVATK